MTKKLAPKKPPPPPGGRSLHELRVLVEQAARSDAPQVREAMAQEAIRHLQTGAPLPDPIRLWLLFVVRRLVQKGAGAIPTFAKPRGRKPAISVDRKREQLLRFLYSWQRQGLPLSVGLDDAKHELGAWTRDFFYSDDFWAKRMTLKAERKKRRKAEA